MVRPRRTRGGDGRRRRGRGVLDGPLITQHALFGMRPKNMPAYGVGRRRKRRTTTYGVGARKRPVYVSRMGMGRRKRRGGSLLGHLHDYVKSNRLVSKGLHQLSKHVSHPLGNKIVTVARNFAATKGYGRRKRRAVGMGRRRRRGGSLLGSLHSYVKSNRLISKGLHQLSKHVSHPIGHKIATAARNFAATQGYGRRRRRRAVGMGPGIMTGMGRRRKRRRTTIPKMAQIASMGPQGAGRRRRRRGGSIFSDIGDFLKKHKVLSTLGKAITPLAGPLAPLVSGATTYAEQHGYGRRHHHLHHHHSHPRHHLIKHSHVGMGIRQRHSHVRRGGNNPYPTTNSFYGKPVF